MKNMFNYHSGMFHMQAKRLSLLLLLLLLSLSSVYALGISGSITMTAKVAHNSVGLGTVYIDGDAGSWTPTVTGDNGNTTFTRMVSGSATGDVSMTWQYNASPKPGYYVTWYQGDYSAANASIPTTGGRTDNPLGVTLAANWGNSKPTITYTAVFKTNYKFYNLAQVKVKGVTATETPGWVYVDNGEKEYSAIAGNEWQRETATYGDNSVINRPTYTYTYYAKANTTDDDDPTNDYTFTGWFDNIECIGKPLSTDIEYEYTSNFKDDQANPLTPAILYARFEKDKYYFYQDPSVYVVGEKNGGQVKISNQKSGEVTDWGTEINSRVGYAHSFKASTSNDTEDFTITYQAKNNDASLYAFWGWGESPTSTPTEDMKSLEYTRTYTASQENTSSENPLPIDPLYAIFKSYYYKVPAVLVATNSKDAGKVYIDLTAEGTSDGYKDAIYASEEYIQVPADAAHSTYTCHYYAQANTGAEFRGWSTTADGKNIISDKIHYSTTYTVTSTDSNNPDVAPPLYAVFASYIDIQQQDRMICYVDNYGNYNINDTKIILELLKAPKLVAELKASLAYPDNDKFSLSNAEASQVGNKVEFDATQGLINLKLSYVGDLSNAIGKTAYITLTGLNGENVIVERTISVVVEKAPIVTFVPTDGKGAYTVSLTDGSGVFYDMPAEAKEDLQVQIAQESMANIEMKLTSPVQNGDYIFFAWKKTEGNVSTYISTDPTCVYEFTEPAIVQPEFVHKDQASFIIKSQPNKIYADLHLALKDAEVLKANTGEDQIVVFANDFANAENEKTEGFLPRGDYTISSGITLLIPGDNTYTPICGDPKDFYSEVGGTAKVYRKLIVESGTTITVYGNISLSVDKIYNGGPDKYLARPGNYGQMELQSNAKITIKDGAGLYAFGFLTGDKTSSIVAENGATVYELLQITDYRGGSGTAAMYQTRGNDKVFPFNQYYIQNIEVATEFKYGATEYLSSGATMSGSVTALSSQFITSGNVEGAGLFNIGENSSVIKYYDPITDRLKFTVRGGSSRLGYMLMDLGWVIVMNVVVDTREYVLPINNNMDIVLENTTVVAPYDMAWLPGATLSVDKNSLFEIDGGRIYVYDKDERVNNVNDTYRNEGYFGAAHSKLSPITYTPNNSQKSGSSYKRTPDNLKDATWTIDGKVNVKTGGGLYTTAGNAQIISNGQGQVQFHSTLGARTTNQSQYVAGGTTDVLFSPSSWRSLVQFPVNSARLQNADKSYVETQNGNYIYNPAKGKWEKTSALTDSWTIPTIHINLPTESKSVDVISFINGVTTSENIDNLTIEIEGEGFSKGEGKYESGKGLVIPVTYDATGVAGEYVATITIRNNNQTYTQLVKAIEDYTPDYNVNSTSFETYINTPLPLEPFIEPMEGNVTTLVDDENMKWNWSISGNAANQFELHLGTGDAKLSKSQLTFTPSSTGTKTAMLHLTASYTDNGGQVHSMTKEIPLTGIAKALEENTLAFADLSAIYVGQTNPINLFTGNGSNGTITITITDEINVDESGDKLTVTKANFGIAGSGESMTINPKKTGTYTIKAVQSPSATVAGTTITQTITIYPRVKWNWENMYFGENYDNPITFMDGTSPEYTLVEETDAQNVVNYNKDTKTATISAWETGEAEATFTFTQQGYDPISFTSYIHRDPRRLRVDVNAQRTFDAVNAGKFGVSFDNLNKTIVFNSPKGQVSQWTMYFIGVPDELYFTPTRGMCAWQIEESTNGTNWVTTYPWAHIANNTPFSLSLSPTTRYLRITYGAATVESEAVLDKFYVTALQTIKANVNKLYMPITTPNPTKDVVFTYANLDGELVLETSDAGIFALSDITLPPTTEDDPYAIKSVTLTSSAQTEQQTGAIYVKQVKNDIEKILLEIPIQPYQYPQDLPIFLATDHVERYYYVTTKSYHTTWNAASREVTFDNAVSDASPFVTFYFSDVSTPGLISFEHTPNCKGIWRIQESEDELDWTVYDIKPNANNTISQTLTHTSNYVRLSYISPYAEIIDVTDLAIVPTASIMVNPDELTVFKGEPGTVQVTANNITDAITITSSSSNFTLNDIASSLVGQGTKKADLSISYIGETAMEQATITFVVGGNVLATINVTGRLGTLTNGTTGIKTGVPDGYEIPENNFEGSTHRDVNLTNAFAGTTPLFDYVFIFGETVTMDDSKKISHPTSSAGSNALTPCYIYKKGSNGYDFYAYVDNANASTKVVQDFLKLTNDKSETLKVYITGFCPYASTGYTKVDEGVFFFQGGKGDKVHVYLEDCFIYSRYKTFDGHSFIDRSNGESYSEDYVRGSGAVLVFECTAQGNSADADRFDVTIHTRGRNLLKSHYGCFFESIVGRAFQVSSPVQIHMAGGELFVRNSYTTLNFDDVWPIAVDANGSYTDTERTNGFLSLQKQVNNAPSIDLGNANTILNFNGGQVELQNAQVVSNNYKTTMAISHRSGEFGGFRLSYGMGSDDSGGTVNFNDGTTTVQRMKVAPEYQVYYLMDEDDPSTTKIDESQYTSCLRCPANTHVFGGSHCMMRACSEPTSKGGAPTDADGTALGLYKYPQHPADGHKGGWEVGVNNLVIPLQVPNGYGVASVTPNPGENGIIDAIPCEGDCDDYLNFWFDSKFEPSAVPEVDQKLSYWKACMPYIGAEYIGYTREIGGPTVIERNATVQTELITNFLYCQIDENISNVISSGNYYAPVKNPTPSGGYESIKPTKVGTEYQNYVETYDVTNPEVPIPTGDDFTVAGKIYYITTIPQADIWMTFTAPFDIENVYVVEAFDEDKLSIYSSDRNEILKYQASHNANFAAFFGVAMALGSDVPFENINRDYEGWARTQDNGKLERGIKNLIHYYREEDENGEVIVTNWNEAHYYLYENTNNWTKTEDESVFNTNWEFVKKQGTVLMQKNHTYSMFFPYCMGCFDENGERDFWDYWSGKFIIFESTQASEDAPHEIMGSKNLGSTSLFPNPDNYEPINGRVTYEYDWPFEKEVVEDDFENTVSYLNENAPTDASLKLMGNPSFSLLGTRRSNIYTYDAKPVGETFEANVKFDENDNPIALTKEDNPALIQPTESFLLGKVIESQEQMPIRVDRSGNTIYGYLKDSNNGNQSGTTGNMPTVGGGNDMFITAIDGGINIAVAAPQVVRVLSSTGSVIFAGTITTATDVLLPTSGIYIISGENEVQKILY